MNKLSILYAEDNDILRFQYVKFLNTLFDTVYEAKDGKEALDIYTKKNPDILLLDINMPKVNGLEVAHEIRKKDEISKIIMLTSNSENEKLLEAIPLKLEQYLVKPIKLNELKSTLNSVIEKLRVENSCTIILSDNLIFCNKNNRVYENNKEIKLTKNEIKLVKLFLENRGYTLETEIIFNYIWDDLDYSMTKLRSLINRLNSKLTNKLIQSEYGIGYKLI